MTDRELLELAARAAGIEFKHGYTDGNGYLYFPPKSDHAAHARAGRFWNPLTDEGDALRLAVKLRIDISQQPHAQRVVALWEGHASCVVRHLSVDYEADSYAATRRAIVRAAAEIGKAQP